MKHLLLRLCALLLCAAHTHSHLFANPADVAVALAPTVLHRRSDSVPFSSDVLGTLVQETLQHDAGIRLVERAELGHLIDELSRAATSSTRSASPQAGALEQAAWLVRLHLRTYSNEGPKVEAEVIDTLRGDALSRREAPLKDRPHEGMLTAPDDTLCALATSLTRDALEEARTTVAKDRERTLIAPLLFINRSGSERVSALDPLLRKALARLGPDVRCLEFSATDGSIAESALVVAGLASIARETWEHVADGYAWGEYYEAADYAGPVEGTPVTLELHLWGAADDVTVERLEGTVGRLSELAEQAAELARSRLAGARLRPSAERRSEIAGQLAAAADLVERESANAGAKTPRHQTLLTRALKLIELAAFFAPENENLEHRRSALRLKTSSLEPELSYAAAEFWDLFRRRYRGDGSDSDGALLALAPSALPKLPGYAVGYSTYARALRTGPATPDAVRARWTSLLEAIEAVGQEPETKEAVEALWPAVAGTPNTEGDEQPPPPRPHPALSRLFSDDEARLGKLLEGALVKPYAVPAPRIRVTQSAPRPTQGRILPPLDPTRRPSTSPPQQARPTLVFPYLSRPGVFLEWIKLNQTEILRQLDGSELALAQRLEPPAYVFDEDHATAEVGGHLESRFEVAMATIEPTRLLLCFAARTGEQRVLEVAPGCSATRWLPEGLGGGFPVSSVWAEAPGELWVGTAGGGVRVLGGKPGGRSLYTTKDGLDQDQVDGLFRGKTALYVSTPAVGDRPVTTLPLDGAAPTVTSSPKRDDFPGLSKAALAAIESFDGTPRVVLPKTPSIASSPGAPTGSATSGGIGTRPVPTWDPLLSGRISENQIAALQRARFARTTGARDGLWVASLRTVVWASGKSVVPLAHWVNGEIEAIEDDGDHLLVVVSPRQLGSGSPEPTDTRFGNSDNQLYIYDHRNGRWLGWLSWGHRALLGAGYGKVLCLAPNRPNQLVLIDLSGQTPPVLPANARWTPLHAAVWSRDTAAIQALLRSGADPYRPDALGATPLGLAASWGGVECLRLLLEAPASQRAPEPPKDPRLPQITNPLTVAQVSNRRQEAALLERRQRAEAATGADKGDKARGTPSKPRGEQTAPHFAQPSGEAALEFRRLLAAPVTNQAAVLKLVNREGGACLGPEDAAATLTALAMARSYEILGALIPRLDPGVLSQPALFPDRGNMMGSLCRRLIKQGQTELVRSLAKHAVTPEFGQRDGLEIRDLCKALLEQGAADLLLQFHLTRALDRDRAGTLVLPAVEHGDPGLLQEFLRLAFPAGRMTVELTDANGRSALAVALEAGHAECVALLRKYGASASFAERTLRAPLAEVVCRNPEVAIAYSGRSGSADCSPDGALLAAKAQRGDEEVPTSGITKGALLYRDPWGNTVLHTAAYYGRLALLKALLSAGADVDCLSRAGQTPLQRASLRGHIECVEHLLAAGASVDLTSADGVTPLVAAASRSNVAIVKRLLAAGAEPNRRCGANRSTALAYAVGEYHGEETARTLLAAGARTDSIDADGYDLYGYAARSGYAGLVHLLKGLRLQPTAPRSEAEHPLWRPVLDGDSAMVGALLDAGLWLDAAHGASRNLQVRARLATHASARAKAMMHDELEWPELLSMEGDWRAAIRSHLAAGGRLEYHSGDWGSPLLLAMRLGGPERVHLLMELGADKTRDLCTRNAVQHPLLHWFAWVDARSRDADFSASHYDTWGTAYLETFAGSWSRSDQGPLTTYATRAGLVRCSDWLQKHPAP